MFPLSDFVASASACAPSPDNDNFSSAKCGQRALTTTYEPGRKTASGQTTNLQADNMKDSQLWIAFALGSALFAGLTAILGKIGVSGLNSNLATVIRTVVILLFAGTLVGARGEWTGIDSVGPKSWLFLILSGLATGASWLCYYRALQLAPASRVAPLDKLGVVVAIVLGVLFLKEPVSVKLVLGRALIATGAVLIATI